MYDHAEPAKGAGFHPPALRGRSVVSGRPCPHHRRTARDSGQPSGRRAGGYGQAVDLLDRVRLLRPAGGFARGTLGTVADVWCEGRCVVEIDSPAGPSYVEIEDGALERLDPPASAG
jgi:hypothetical protein